MKTTMTSRERILATCAHQETDHVPLHLEVHPSYLTHHPHIATWRNQVERTEFLLSLGVDAIVEVWLPDPTYHPNVVVREWREESNGQVLLGKEYRTPAGTLRQVIRETDDLYTWHKINRNTRGPLADLIDGVGLLEDVNPSRSVEFLVKGPEDLAAMRYLFQPMTAAQLATWREDAHYARREADRLGTALVMRRLFCGSAMLWLTDALKTMVTFETDPGYMEEFLDIIFQWQKGLLAQVLDVAPVDIVTRFGYYDTTDFWGKQYFDRYLRPLMDMEADLVHQAGALLSQQQSETLTQQADIYKKMKVDILRDVDPHQGHENMVLLKRELGDAKTLMGGINGDVFLPRASAEEIDQTVQETLALMAPGGGFILHVVPGVYFTAPWEKVLALVDAWKKHA
jgi:hypothetical protein